MKLTKQQKESLEKILNDEDAQEYKTYLDGALAVMRVLEIKAVPTI